MKVWVSNLGESWKLLTCLQQINIFGINYVGESKHDSYCQKSYMFCPYSDAFMYKIQLIDSFITAGVFSLEYLSSWLAEEAKYTEMLSSILDLAVSFPTFWVKSCAKSPGWLTVIKFVVLIWKESFAVDNHKIDGLFLESIFSWMYIFSAYFLLKDESSTDICHSWLRSAVLYLFYEDEYPSVQSI